LAERLKQLERADQDPPFDTARARSDSPDGRPRANTPPREPPKRTRTRTLDSAGARSTDSPTPSVDAHELDDRAASPSQAAPVAPPPAALRRRTDVRATLPSAQNDAGPAPSEKKFRPTKETLPMKPIDEDLRGELESLRQQFKERLDKNREGREKDGK
jgi:hypothetical protein